MDRRNLIVGSSAFAAGLFPFILRAAPDPAGLSTFDRAFLRAQKDLAAVDKARAFKDSSIFSFAEAQPGARIAPSARTISKRAKDLIVFYEVSNETLYNQKYRSPTWPGGDSGLTIGIGYDLGFNTPQSFTAFWKGIIPDEQISRLSGACESTGQNAKILVSRYNKEKISWTDANAQFERFLPYAVAVTEHAFPNCTALNDHSFGALVSLVYNRGGNVSGDNPRRAEMAEIRRLTIAGAYAGIPQQIRLMKRLWENNKNARGLLARRDLEADLFEAGLES